MVKLKQQIWLLRKQLNTLPSKATAFAAQTAAIGDAPAIT
jgi:hypothetical protein